MPAKSHEVPAKSQQMSTTAKCQCLFDSARCSNSREVRHSDRTSTHQYPPVLTSTHQYQHLPLHCREKCQYQPTFRCYPKVDVTVSSTCAVSVKSPAFDTVDFHADLDARPATLQPTRLGSLYSLAYCGSFDQIYLADVSNSGKFHVRDVLSEVCTPRFLPTLLPCEPCPCCYCMSLQGFKCPPVPPTCACV
jgi:hypothetical protein